MSQAQYLLELANVSPARRVGHVTSVTGGRIEAAGPLTSVGDICAIASGPSGSVLGEVAAVRDRSIAIVPFEYDAAIAPDARVVALPARAQAPVGDAFSGRAIDALGAAIDGMGALFPEAHAPIHGAVMAPMERADATDALTTGVRAIDGLLTLGRGQRIGLFSASGVGKTTLMTQLAFGVAADRVVVCLVGERGREVEALWAAITAREDRARFTCVAATSDQSAPIRARAPSQALALAEYWRARGEHVLFIVDSVTRLAMALREIGLVAGAPPTLRAYTPNVFSALPRLVERCGAAKAGGSISAIMTVLSETDDNDDPIVEIMKSLLDGHIVLSRTLAEQGAFPPIDVLKSVSRLSSARVNGEHARAATQVLALSATYEEARLMIESGLHKPGVNPRVDDAIRNRSAIQAFLRQRSDEHAAFETTRAHLTSLGHGGARHG